jgi:glycosyltransferase involved in cell wall biosynthesis
MKLSALITPAAKKILLFETRANYKRRQHQKILNQLKNKTSTQEKISILLPIYNAQHSLEKCLDSILNQTYQNFEIICVDDASTDRSLMIVKDYLNRDSRIHLIDKAQNQGSSFARRDALKKAKGTYVLCIDSDDWIEPTMLEDLYHFAQQDPSYDMVYCDYYKNGTIMHAPKILEENQSLKRIKGRSFAFGNMLWNRLVKKEVFDQVTFQAESMGEDVYINTQLYFFSDKIAYLCKPLYHYNQFSNTDSISDRPSLINILDMEANYQHMQDFLSEKFGSHTFFERAFEKKARMIEAAKKKIHTQ